MDQYFNLINTSMHGQPGSKVESESLNHEFRLPKSYDIPQIFGGKDSVETQGISPAKMKQFPDKVLFYIFYNMPHDKSQLSASNELQSRSWIYIGDMVKWIKINSSKKEQQHFTSKKNSKNGKGQKNLKIESSSYSIIIFNPKLWKEEQVYLQED